MMTDKVIKGKKQNKIWRKKKSWEEVGTNLKNAILKTHK